MFLREAERRRRFAPVKLVVTCTGVTRSAPEPLIIGVTEYVDIPQWRILHLRAKIDTGARSSALHVENIRQLASGRVRFDVRLSRSESERRVTVEAPVARGELHDLVTEMQLRLERLDLLQQPVDQLLRPAHRQRPYYEKWSLA